MQKIISLKNMARTLAVVSAFVLALSTGAAYAVNIGDSCVDCVDDNISEGFSASNEVTGPYSENENEVEIENESTVDIENDFDANNDYDVDVETGDNEISYNTEAGDVLTGDITGDIEFVNAFDLGLGDIDLDLCGGLCPFDSEVFVSNEVTGPYSENENEVSIENDHELNIENEVEFNNDLELDLSTGENEVAYNTIVGDVTTGDIDVDAEVRNEISGLGDIDFDSHGGSNGEVFLENSKTGYNSENENEVEIENNSAVNIENEVEFNNDIDVDATTGENEIIGNTCVGDIETGSIDLNIEVLNEVE